ncbi:carotenoid biosynthesis protein [Crocinitomicaceae bacterium]|nr:carotenoid biosynthesis protein [Crocinitomicaceae bacterium]
MKSFKLNKVLTAILIFFLSIGLIGFFTPFEAWFKSLSFQNLLLTFLLVSISFKSIFKQYALTLATIFTIGFICEVIGVNKGWIFGNYTYTENLGLSLFKVPLIIGINWAILTMGAWQIVRKIKVNNYSKILLGALLMVVFDFIMEPVAIQLNFWNWENNVIPVFNYLSWFSISIITMCFCLKNLNTNKGIVKQVFIVQLAFFLILNIKYSWL